MNKDNKLGEDATKKAIPVDNGPIDNVLSIKEAIDKQPKVKILIPSTDAENEINPVVLSNGGYAIQITRDAPVSVSISWLEILDHCVITQYKQVARKDGEGYELIPTPTLRFPYQILSALPEGYRKGRE